VDHRLITPYNPQANGLAERWVQTTSVAIYKLLDGSTKDWDLYVPSVQYFTNLKICARHGSASFSLMFARKANTFEDFSGTQASESDVKSLQEKLDSINYIVFPIIRNKAKLTGISMFNQHSKHKAIISQEKFKNGSLVMVKDDTITRKEVPPYEGPMVVVKRNHGGAYILKGKDGTEYQRVANQMKLVNQSPDLDTFFDNSLKEVKKELAKVDNDHYLVQFKGSKDPQKVHRDNLQADHLLSQFERPPKRLKNGKTGLKLRFTLPKQ
jgi:hypothetical protein